VKCSFDKICATAETAKNADSEESIKKEEVLMVSPSSSSTQAVITVSLSWKWIKLAISIMNLDSPNMNIKIWHMNGKLSLSLVMGENGLPKSKMRFSLNINNHFMKGSP